jgi:hypothetical protein
MATMAAMCRASKEWYDKAAPLLWGDIDFATPNTDPAYDQEDMNETLRQFFATCDTMITEQPEIWTKTLAPRVRSLRIGHIPGTGISYDTTQLCEYYLFVETGGEDRRNIYDVIAHFENLQTLALYVKTQCFVGEKVEERGKALAMNLKKLRNVKVGGQMMLEILLGLLSRPEQVQHLSLINLVYTSGQDHGPPPIDFLEPIQARLTSLTSLHLCKSALLTEDEGITGLRWEWHSKWETDQLEEWRDLLHHVSGTLTELTLENRYHTNHWNLNDVPGVVLDSEGCLVEYPADFGKKSYERCWKLLFPVFSEKEWPKLQKLRLFGMYLSLSPDALGHVGHWDGRVDIQDRLGEIVFFNDDTTPLELSPPYPLFQDPESPRT